MKYNIPESNRSKPIIVISEDITNEIIDLLKSGKTTNDVTTLMNLPKDKSIYGKVYRLSCKI